MTRSIRLVADDLTGALDAAAPFAMADGPLPIVWDADLAAARRGSLALDLESRDLPDVPAEARWVEALRGADISFKKLDSLLRGRPAEELHACIAGRRFASVVIAPAFPAQRRITRGGRQHWRPTSTEAWRPVERDLAGELRALRIEVQLVSSPQELGGDGVFLCDAASEDDLRATVEAGVRLAPPVLWAGTAGLAHALAGPPRHSVPDPTAPLLVVVGSHHPVARAQVEVLGRAHPEALVRAHPTCGDGALARALASRLAHDGLAALVFDFPDGTATAEAAVAIERGLAALVRRLEPPRSLLVTGGATLFALMQASGAGSLVVQGEVLPGVASSTVAGGRFDGATVVSKSGAFGDADTLVYLAGLRERAAHG